MVSATSTHTFQSVYLTSESRGIERNPISLNDTTVIDNTGQIKRLRGCEKQDFTESNLCSASMQQMAKSLFECKLPWNSPPPPPRPDKFNCCAKSC